MPTPFRCTLVTPQRQVFDQQVTYASIPAWDGQIGLMHQRTPLLVKLGDGPLRIDKPDGSSSWFFLAGGFAQMKQDHLAMLTGDAVAAEEVIPQEAEAALREAEARVAHTEEEVQRKQCDLDRARTLVQIAQRRGAAA